MSFPPEQPTTAFPYRIEAQVGEGSMGVVYRALEPALGRLVAIKTLHPHVLTGKDLKKTVDNRLRFEREARAAAALTHPGVTTIYRIGEEAGVPFIAMEWLDGRNLETIVEKEGRLGAEAVTRLALDLLAALGAAHEAGVVHRDIKPANLMLLRDGRLKVTDFGIARLRGSDLLRTEAGIVLATPRFASPEQIRGGEVDGRSDLFSTGILLFYLLTGVYPFGGEDFLQTATAILREEPAPLRSLNPAVPARLAEVIERALRKSRDERFTNAAEMAAALRGEPAGLATERQPSAAAPATSAAPASGKVLTGLPGEPARLAAAVVQGWPAREIGAQDIRQLLERLLDPPLHAPAFAGAVSLGDVCLFLADGLLLGAVRASTGKTGDGVVEALPARAAARLHPAPEELGAGAVRTLASLLHPPRLRLEGLDSSFVNLPALGDRLRQEKLDGLLRLERAGSTGYVLLSRGEAVLSAYAGPWPGVALEEPWERWVSDVAVKAAVQEVREEPAFLTYRRELKNVELRVERPAADGTGSGRGTRADRRDRTVTLLPVAGGDRGLVERDPMTRLLRWALEDLPPFFRERDRTGRWKYLVEWLADVRTARLHHELPRPGTREKDAFDLVTFDGDGRALHLAHRFHRLTPQAFAGFIARVREAKTARTRTGDVGGVFLVARRFEEEALAAYHESARSGGAGGSGRWFGIEENLTGYEGFVRIGPRRGFHLLLVEESDDGFTPLLFTE